MIDKNAWYLRLKNRRNRLLFKIVTILQPLYQALFKSDVAYIYCIHPVITPFLVNLKLHLGVTIHFLQPGSDFSRYRKVIVPNGMWPNIKPTADQIPESKKVYCEVAFFPQNRNVYFDDKGIHGFSSVLDAELEDLTQESRERLESFKSYYTSRNFVKYDWDSIDSGTDVNAPDNPRYQESFFFVPLQLEADTAFDLCPFESNQEMISRVESALPGRRIIFKVHPLDQNQQYEVRPGNEILPPENNDLRELILFADAVISCNSTVMLEALLYGKKCASLGIGFATNHGVTLECHENVERLTQIDDWKPDPAQLDRFLNYLLEKQINIKFWRNSHEKNKARQWLTRYGIMT